MIQWHLKQMLTKRKMSVTKLAALLGVNRVTVSGWANSDSIPNFESVGDTLEALCFHLNCRVQDLVYQASDDPHEVTYTVPFLAEMGAGAGPGYFIDDDPEHEGIAFSLSFLRRILKADPKYLSLIPVCGDSMAPTLLHGDILMVDSSEHRRHSKQEGIYVFRHDCGVFVKRLSWVGQRILVSSDNPLAGAREIDSADLAEEFNIIGKVIWYCRQA